MTLVIRLSSLGDVVLASSVTAALAPVVFLTRPRYAGLVARFEGVVQVATSPAELPPVDRLVDLQSSPWTWTRFPGAERVAMHRWARWLRVALKRPGPIPLVVDRYAEVAGVPLAERPWIHEARSDGPVGLVPGAAHATKRWPRWRELAEQLDEVVVFGHPDDAIEWAGEQCIEAGFERTLPALAACRVVAGPDTGLLHLAGALGVPVLTLFGPTTSGDGFACHPGRSLELDLPCRPCSRHGSERCPVGDHACMVGIEPEQVAAAIQQLSG